MWDDWNAIEAAQQKADADDAQRRADREARKAGTPTDATPAPVADPEAAAAVQEAERLTWVHPIPPMRGGPAPTNADGTPRAGFWPERGPWVDRQPVDMVRGIRLLAAQLRRQIKGGDEE